MTTATVNPYCQIFCRLLATQRLVLDEWNRISWNMSSPDGKRTIRHFNLYRKRYSYSIPDETVIERIRRHTDRVVEMGAGSGYWARCLSEAGLEVVAFDNRSSHLRPRQYGRWYPVKSGGPRQLKHYASHALLLVWPPYENPMAAECLKHWRGTTLVYVGEPYGGCCANDEFFKMLDLYFELVENFELMAWPGIHDWFHVYQR